MNNSIHVPKDTEIHADGTGGTLYYDGSANLINVNVLSGAKLFGGTYTLNDMTLRMAEGFGYPTTGIFLNHGTIGAMTINGNLFSDGTLQGVCGIGRIKRISSRHLTARENFQQIGLSAANCTCRRARTTEI